MGNIDLSPTIISTFTNSNPYGRMIPVIFDPTVALPIVAVGIVALLLLIIRKLILS